MKKILFDENKKKIIFFFFIKYPLISFIIGFCICTKFVKLISKIAKIYFTFIKVCHSRYYERYGNTSSLTLGMDSIVYFLSSST